MLVPTRMELSEAEVAAYVAVTDKLLRNHPAAVTTLLAGAEAKTKRSKPSRRLLRRYEAMRGPGKGA